MISVNCDIRVIVKLSNVWYFGITTTNFLGFCYAWFLATSFSLNIHIFSCNIYGFSSYLRYVFMYLNLKEMSHYCSGKIIKDCKERNYKKSKKAIKESLKNDFHLLKKYSFRALYFVLVKCWTLLVAALLLTIEFAIIIYLFTKDHGTNQKGKCVHFFQNTIYFCKTLIL